MMNRLQQIMEGAGINDVDHIWGHMSARRDWFVTGDKKHILKHKEALKREFGVIVMAPEEAVTKVNGLLEKGNRGDSGA